MNHFCQKRNFDGNGDSQELTGVNSLKTRTRTTRTTKKEQKEQQEQKEKQKQQKRKHKKQH